MPWYSNLDEAFELPVAGAGGSGAFDQKGYKTQVEPISPPLARQPLTAYKQGPILGAPRLDQSLEAEMVAKRTQDSPLTSEGSAPFIRQMNTCEDFQVHLRNCPNCRAYMTALLAKDEKVEPTKEGFANLFQGGDNSLDLIVLVAIGIFLIFALDSLARLSKNLG